MYRTHGDSSLTTSAIAALIWGCFTASRGAIISLFSIPHPVDSRPPTLPRLPRLVLPGAFRFEWQSAHGVLPTVQLARNPRRLAKYTNLKRAVQESDHGVALPARSEERRVGKECR